MQNLKRSTRITGDREVAGLVGLGTSYQAAQVVFEALGAGLFDALGGRTLTVARLAAKLSFSPDALERLLRVLQALGFVEQKGNSYRNSANATKYLCRQGPRYLGDVLLHVSTLQEQWLQVGRSLKTNRMVQPGKRRVAAYPRQLKKFLSAMDGLGRVKSELIKKKFSLTTSCRMLDLGGGLGTYAMSFALDNNCLRATVFDLKNVVRHARAAIKDAGLQERVKAIAGECLSDPLPAGPFDLVLISNLLHIYGADDCRTIIQKAGDVLAPQGTLLIHDYLFGCGDQLAVGLFDMTMLIGTPGGRCHGAEDVTGWLQSAGLSRPRVAEVSVGTSMVWGKKR